ncbi:MAG: DNA repair protein RecO [Bacteroidales bacterium]|nr:DNA repair protein RecO [Bacteroidales bacterium]
MIASTPGLVLHTTPYAETSVVVKVFTRLFGVRSYIIKGVRGHGGRVKQNMLQPLSSLDMVVYANPKNELNYIKELSPRHPDPQAIRQSSDQAIDNALRFFKTEVLYKALREEEPLPELFDYVDTLNDYRNDEPILFLLTVAHHLGIEPLDNYSVRETLFDLQEGRYVSVATETTLSPTLSAMLHEYLSNFNFQPSTFNLNDRRSLIDALIAYYQLHLSGFRNFNSHEILHTILK